MDAQFYKNLAQAKVEKGIIDNLTTRYLKRNPITNAEIDAQIAQLYEGRNPNRKKIMELYLQVSALVKSYDESYRLMFTKIIPLLPQLETIYNTNIFYNFINYSDKLTDTYNRTEKKFKDNMGGTYNYNLDITLPYKYIGQESPANDVFKNIYNLFTGIEYVNCARTADSICKNFLDTFGELINFFVRHDQLLNAIATNTVTLLKIGGNIYNKPEVTKVNNLILIVNKQIADLNAMAAEKETIKGIYDSTAAAITDLMPKLQEAAQKAAVAATAKKQANNTDKRQNRVKTAKAAGHNLPKFEATLAIAAQAQQEAQRIQQKYDTAKRNQNIKEIEEVFKEATTFIQNYNKLKHEFKEAADAALVSAQIVDRIGLEITEFIRQQQAAAAAVHQQQQAAAAYAAQQQAAAAYAAQQQAAAAYAAQQRAAAGRTHKMEYNNNNDDEDPNIGGGRRRYIKNTHRRRKQRKQRKATNRRRSN